MYKLLNARKPIIGNTDYPVRDHALIDDLKNAANLPGLPFSFNENTTVALTLGLFGGQMSVNGVLTTIADGTIALTGTATNYVEHTAAGVVSKNTVGFSADKFPIAEVVTDAGSITGYTDRRNLNSMLIPGLVSIDVAGAAGTTVLTAAQWGNDILEFTGALTGNRIIEVPTAVSRAKIIRNATSGAFTLTVKTNAGTGKGVTQGKRGAVYCDGTNVEWASDDAKSVGALPATGGELTGPLVLPVSGCAGLVPVGAQIDFMGASAPSGFLLCDGSNVSRATYAALFVAIGTIWGVGDGSTTFTLPDARRRVAVGSGGTGTGTLGNAVGNTGGAESHALTSAENGTHTHTISGTTYAAASGGANGSIVGGGTGGTSSGVINLSADSSGSGTAHNNMPPSMVVTKVIKH